MFTYLRTMLLILLRPTRAARGVAIPDRLGKALRWAVVHLVVLALLGTVFISQPYLQYLLFATGRGFFTTIEPSTANLAEWSAYSLLAWLIALSSYPLLGAALAIAVPGWHPAARRGIVKWTLYSSASISLGVGGALAVAMLLPVLRILTSMGVAQASWFSWYNALLHALDRPWWTIWALVYGCWWAMGVAGNVYLRRRGWLAFLANALVYITAWLTLAKVLLPPGELGALM